MADGGASPMDAEPKPEPEPLADALASAAAGAAAEGDDERLAAAAAAGAGGTEAGMDVATGGAAKTDGKKGAHDNAEEGEI